MSKTMVIRIKRENEPKAPCLACSKWLVLIPGSIIIKINGGKKITKIYEREKDELQCCACSLLLVLCGKSSVKDTPLLKSSNYIFRVVGFVSPITSPERE